MDASDSKEQLRSESLRALQRRLIRHLANGRSTDMADASLRVSRHVFTDPVRLEAEKALLSRVPLVAGLAAEIPEPGDSMLFESIDQSIIVIRGQDRKVRAFLNICTHRGTQLLSSCGRHTSISCPFHGWTFDAQGRLVAQPGSEGFADIDRDKLGLIRVPCAERHGLLFIKTQPSIEPLDAELFEFLGDLDEQLAQWELESYTPGRSCVIEAKANWKYMADTFGEGYHFAALHPDSVGSILVTNVAATRTFGPHHQICYAPKSYRALVSQPESQWPELDSIVFSIFPNTQLLIGIPRLEPGPAVLQLHRLYPETPSSARSHYTVYVKKDFHESPGGREFADSVFEIGSAIVGGEDFAAAERAQRMLATAPNDFAITYGRNEILLQNFQRNLAVAIGMPI